MFYLVGQDFARRDVVAIAEPAGDNEYLVAVEHLFILDDSVYVNAVRRRACQFKGVLRLKVAVNPRRP